MIRKGAPSLHPPVLILVLALTVDRYAEIGDSSSCHGDMAPRIAPDTRNRTQQAHELRVTSFWRPGLTGIQDSSPEDQQLT